MDILIKIEGDALDSFLRFVEKAQNAGCYRLRIAVDGEQLKVKANEYTWTAPMGEVATGPMSVEVRLSLGAQAVLERRIRDLRLVQYSLSDMSADAMSRGLTVAAVKFADEADAIRQALNEVETVLRVAQQNTTEGQDR